MRITLFILSLIACPIAYDLLITAMRERQVLNPPRLPFFFIFGTIGGWLLALALSPSGLAATCVVFLVTLAPLVLAASSLKLAKSPERTVFHKIAMWFGVGYPLALLLMLVIGALVG